MSDMNQALTDNEILYRAEMNMLRTNALLHIKEFAAADTSLANLKTHIASVMGVLDESLEVAKSRYISADSRIRKEFNETN